ncbi:MAG: dicarboxylate/amino acid:cation symporter [Pseudomonadota bacterium]
MLHIAIAIGLLLGLLVGLAAAATGNEWLLAIAQGVEPLGRIFMNAIRMVVIPLVVVIIFSSIAKLGNPRTLGKIGGLTFGYYAVTLFPAIVVGMAVMKFGLQFAADITVPTNEPPTVPQLRGFVDFLVSLIPPNPFAAANAGAMLPLIVFTALVAAAAGTIEASRRDRLIQFADDASAALIKLVWWILYLAPIGVFGLVAPVTATLGWDLITSLVIFILCVAAGLLIYTFAVMLPLVWLLARIAPAKFLRGTFGALSITVSSTSTAVALPVTREETHKNLGVSRTVTDLLIPFTASTYRPGTALFQGASIVFLAYLFDVPVPVAVLGGAVLATFLVSLTVAPVPSSGVVTMAPALEAAGVPGSGLAILLGIDRIPDMMRSGVNVLGHISTAAIVDRFVDVDDVNNVES